MQIETKELATVKVQVTKAAAAAEQLTIKKPEDMPVAVELLSKIKTVGNLIKEKKEGITKPLNEALKNARDLFRPVEEGLASAEGIVKTKMVDYANEVEAREREEREKINKKVEQGKLSLAAAAKKVEKIETVDSVSTKSGAAEFRTVKKVVIESPDLVPMQYRVIDEVAVRKDALAGVQIPGVKVVEEKSVASYTKKTEDHMGKLSKK